MVAAIEEVTARAPEWRIRHGGWKLLSPGLDTAYSEGREAFAALGESPSFDAVHDLRKRGKDLWYQVRLLRDAWESVLEATAEEIHDFTDRLGDHHGHQPHLERRRSTPAPSAGPGCAPRRRGSPRRGTQEQAATAPAPAL